MTNLTTISSFVELVLTEGLFSPPGLKPQYMAPEAAQGDSVEIIRYDFNYVLARWFVDGIRPQIQPTKSEYVHFYSAVKSALKTKFPHASDPDLHKASTSLARVLRNSEIEDKFRRKLTDIEKYELLSCCNRRCQICGFLFPEAIVNGFLDGKFSEELNYTFYDFLKPTRRSLSNYRIEVDHIRPVSQGGSSELKNLQLLCGFCNCVKRDFLTVFDTSANKVMLEHPKFPRGFRLSSWFLVARTLYGNRCKYCGHDINDRELTVAPLVMSQEVNPLNISVTCYECDPIKKHRYLAVGIG